MRGHAGLFKPYKIAQNACRRPSSSLDPGCAGCRGLERTFSFQNTDTYMCGIMIDPGMGFYLLILTGWSEFHEPRPISNQSVGLGFHPSV